jgi:hypothetical protein
MKTWEDVERAARHDAILHAGISLARSGYITRQQALIAAALALSEHDRSMLEMARTLLRKGKIVADDLPKPFGR